MGWLRKIRSASSKGNDESKGSLDQLPSEKQVKPVSHKLQENLTLIKEIMGEGSGLIIAEFEIAGGWGRAGVVYLEGMTDTEKLNEHVIKALVNGVTGSNQEGKPSGRHRLETIRTRLLTTADVNETDRIEQIIVSVLKGDTGLFVNGTAAALIIGIKGFKLRSIEVPETEVTVLGSKEGFTESLIINCTLLRRRFPTPDLRFERFVIGRLSYTEVRLVWIEGIANPKIVEEARRRLGRIDVGYLTGTAMLAELIEDNPLSIWPQVRLTERPDVLAADMAEGRIGLLCDGVPYVMVAPSLFWDKLQSVDDYGDRPLTGSFFRLIRQASFYISLLATSLYVAITNFHHSIIPPVLAIRMASGRDAVPFPTIVEALVLTMTIDLLREAGVRLPRAIGSAVGILGAVVIGQAAVTAGFVSPALIIVVSISAIATFAIPTIALSNATRVANYYLVILGGFIGIFGVVLGMVHLLWGAISLRSFGIPLFYPVAPGENYGLKDVFVRSPVWSLRRRPSLLAPENQVRVGESTVKPGPEHRGGDRGR